MITEGNIPSNIQTDQTISTLGWAIIGILACALIIIVIVAIFTREKCDKEIDKLKTLINTPISDKERNLLLKYRELNDTDKSVINDTLNTLSKNHKDDTHTTE